MSHRTLTLTTKNAGIQAFVWPHLTSPMWHFTNAFVIKQALLGSDAPNASVQCFIVPHSWVACPHRCIPNKFNKYINIHMNSKMYLLNLCRRHHQTLSWPHCEDKCWIPPTHVFCCLPAPVPSGSSARQYRYDEQTVSDINKRCQTFCNSMQ